MTGALSFLGLLLVLASPPGDAVAELGPPLPREAVPVQGAEPAPQAVEPGPVIPAEDAPVPVVTLLEAVEEALLNHPDIGVSREAIRRASGQRLTANGALLPSLDFSYNEVYQKENSVNLGGGGGSVTTQPANTRTFTLSSDWVLFAGGALRANQAIARIAEVAARHQLRATVNEVISNTVNRYLQVLRAQELSGVAGQTVELADEQVRIATVSFEAGAVARVNVLRAEAAQQNALQALLQAENGIELAKASLNQAMGRSQLLPLEVAPLPRQLADTPDLVDSLQLAVAQRPELRAIQKSIDINKEAVRAARAGYYPTIALNGTLERMEGGGAFSNDNNWRLVGILQWNLWDWGQTRGEVRSASADVRAERYRLQQAVQNIELQVRAAILNATEARRRVEVAQAEVDAAGQALEIEQLRYTSGDGIYLELLDARRALSEAQANLVTAYYDNALAEADWLAATGSYLTGDTVTLPDGQAIDAPETYQNPGSEYDDLLRQYQVPPEAVIPAKDGGAK